MSRIYVVMQEIEKEEVVEVVFVDKRNVKYLKTSIHITAISFND